MLRGLSRDKEPLHENSYTGVQCYNQTKVEPQPVSKQASTNNTPNKPHQQHKRRQPTARTKQADNTQTPMTCTKEQPNAYASSCCVPLCRVNERGEVAVCGDPMRGEVAVCGDPMPSWSELTTKARGIETAFGTHQEVNTPLQGRHKCFRQVARQPDQ